MTDTTTTTTEPFLTPHVGVEATLLALVQPIIVAEGLELVVLQLVRSQHADILKMSVDRPGAGVTPGKGVSMAELEHLNRLLGDTLDVEDAEKKLFREEWELEVGSPGVDRPLTKKSHFVDVVGHKVKARLKLEKKSFVGRLDSADDKGIVVEGKAVAFADLDNAHVVYEFQEPQKPGKGTKPGARGSKPSRAELERSQPSKADKSKAVKAAKAEAKAKAESAPST